VNPLFHLISPEFFEFILKKLVTVTHHRVRVIRVTFSRSLGQRSRSVSDGRRNLVNLIVPEPLKVFKPKLAQILPAAGPQTDKVFKVIGSKVTVTEMFSDWRHTCRRFPVKDHLMS